MFDPSAALKAARSGDTITVPPGEYGAVTLSKAKGLTLKGEGATLASLTLSACEGVTVEGVNVRLQPNEATVSSTSAVRVVKSRAITLKGLTVRCGLAIVGLPQDASPNVPRAPYGDSIIGLPIGRGLTLDGCDDVTVEGCDFGASHKGIVLNNSRGLRLIRNNVHDTRTGQISGAGVSDVLIEGNRLSASRPWSYGAKGDHGDFIHLWTDPKYQPGPSEGVTIRGNLLDQADGAPIMGIYLDDNGNNLGFVGARVMNNLIIGGHDQGIRLERTRGVVSGNCSTTSGLRLADLCDVELIGNAMVDVYGTLKAQTERRGASA